MALLRKTIQREVKDILDSSIFTADDFEVKFGDADQYENLVEIMFIANANYSYTITQLSRELRVTRKPGDFQEEERALYPSLPPALEGIHQWCKDVRNELKASLPLYNEVDKLRSVIEEHIKGDGDADEFSAEEIFALRKKFEDLEDRVSKLEKDKVITGTQMAEFRTGITQVKEDLEFYPRKTWIRTATNKLVKIVMTIGKSKEGRKMIADGARKLIGLD